MLDRARLSLFALALLSACTGKEPAADSGQSGATDADADGIPTDEDCNDVNASIFPGADELCNNVDDDCDGEVDEDAVDPVTVYTDADRDGFGDDGTETVVCERPSGSAEAGGDCDDADPAVNPGATEVCDAADLDEDCSGAADDADAGVDPASAATWFADADADGYGVDASPVIACDSADGRSAEGGDCDDAAPSVHPHAVEVCDDADVDEDCSGAADDEDEGVDLATASVRYDDVDGDGYGDAEWEIRACDPPASAALEGTDCDDGNAGVHPAATEICDAEDVDEDCDGFGDDADDSPSGRSAWYADLDGDGFGDPATMFEACDVPEAHVADLTDCDDASGNVYPGAAEFCDGIANDCGTLADWTADAELGVASWVDGSGVWSAVTDTLAAGTAEAPVVWTAPDDGELRLCDGTFHAQIDGSSVTLSISGLNGAESTIIDAGGTGSVVGSTGGVLTVSGVTLRNGSETNGGGLRCLATELLVEDAIVTANTASSSGGGIFLQTCNDAVVRDTRIEGNTGASGAGLYATTSTGLILEGLEVTGNAASVTGGGLNLSTTEFTVSASTLSGNSAGGSYNGGGASVSASTGTLDGVTISDNTAGTGAGLLVSVSTVDITGSTFSGNEATGSGAALRAYYRATVNVTSTLFSENVSGAGAPVYLDTNSTGAFTSCAFTLNAGADGGALGVTETSTGTIVTSDFSDNTPNDAWAAGTAYTFGSAASATCDDTSGCY